MGVINYLQETKGELKHVSWPTQRQAFNFTTLVIFLSIAVALLLSFFDLVFNFLLKLII